MLNENLGEFTKLLAATMDVYGRPITTSFAKIFFAALWQYDLPTVKEALNRHIQDPDGGRFAPKPADLIRQITNAVESDGRPEKNEAWAIAQLALDETRTVVLTEEIVAALEIAKPLIFNRDKVAARMAFLEAYERFVADRRAQYERLDDKTKAGTPRFEWQVSLGTDKSLRIPVIENAKVLGQLPPAKAMLMIEAEREVPISQDGLAIVGLIGSDKPLSTEELRARWQDVRRKVAGQSRQEKMDQQRREIEQAERELEEMKRGSEQ